MSPAPEDAADPRLWLDRLPAGLLVLDADHRLLYANPALWAQGETDPLPPGTPLAEVAARLAARGHSGAGDAETHLAQVLALDRTRPRRRLFRNRQDRWHDLTLVPLPGGASLSLSLDVTGLDLGAEEPERGRRMEALLHGLDTGVAEYGDDGRLRFHNPAYAALLGADPAFLRDGPTLAQVLDHLEARGAYAPGDRALIPHPPPLRWDGIRRRPDGTALWVRVEPLPGGGRVIQVSDVTDRLRAEAEADRRLVLLDDVMRALPHGVCVYGPDLRVAMVNGAYQRIMRGAEVRVGEGRAEVAARRAAAGEYDRDEAPARRRATGAPADALEAEEWRRNRPDGTVVQVRSAPLAGGGRILVLTDETARHRAEAEAATRAAHLRAMLENLAEGVALYDAEGRLVAANPLLARMSGIPAEAMVPGTPVAALREAQIEAGEFGPPGDPRREAMRLRGGALPFRPADRYLRHRADGTVLEVRTDATPDGGWIRVTRDVTAEHRALAELEAARDAAEAASRAKTRFLATITHELRTPLNAVLGFSEAILAEERPETMRAHAGEVLAAGRGLLELVDGILEVTRIESGSLALRSAAFDPRPTLRGAAAAAAAAARLAGVSLEAELDRNLPPVRGDERRLRQVLDALLSNAVKFTPEGGAVSLTARAWEGGTLVTISDSGIGMASEDIPRAFEAFTQLEAPGSETGLARRYPGSGLGLTLARALARAMGVDFELDSAPGRGTTARLRLPAAPAQETDR